MTSTVLTNIGELFTDPPTTQAALVIEGDRIAWLGPAIDAPAADSQVDVGGRAVLPGFVDSHSHLVFAGDRAEEFAARMTGTRSCFCPTTERDLGDGVGPSRRLHDAGSPLTLGSDSHAVIDLFEEMRAVEMDERLASHQRGHWSAKELITAATTTGHASLGFPDAGEIRQGHRADLVTLDTSSPRTAGTGADDGTAVFAATAADVTQVMVDGRIVFEQGDRERIGRDLADAIDRLHV